MDGYDSERRTDRRVEVPSTACPSQGIAAVALRSEPSKKDGRGTVAAAPRPGGESARTLFSKSNVSQHPAPRSTGRQVPQNKHLDEISLEHRLV